VQTSHRSSGVLLLPSLPLASVAVASLLAKARSGAGVLVLLRALARASIAVLSLGGACVRLCAENARACRSVGSRGLSPALVIQCPTTHALLVEGSRASLRPRVRRALPRARAVVAAGRISLGLRPAYARAPRVSRRATASATTRHGALMTGSGGRGRARHLGISSGRGHSIVPSRA
jgi:hypothetical protein